MTFLFMVHELLLGAEPDGAILNGTLDHNKDLMYPKLVALQATLLCKALLADIAVEEHNTVNHPLVVDFFLLCVEWGLSAAYATQLPSTCRGQGWAPAVTHLPPLSADSLPCVVACAAPDGMRRSNFGHNLANRQWGKPSRRLFGRVLEIIIDIVVLIYLAHIVI
jgi:hypothetical protein